MKNKKINCIIVKDLSRFARNHIEADMYLENIFPALNIRFISVTEKIDSFKNPEMMDNLIVWSIIFRKYKMRHDCSFSISFSGFQYLNLH